MKPNCLRVISLLILASVALNAQIARQENAVPLKNWATPLYWQRSQDERGSPQLQFSLNAVSDNALTFIAITPCRLVDTRGNAAGFNGLDPFAGPSIAGGGTLTIPVQSTPEASVNTEPAPCGVIPGIAQAYSFNLTVVPHAGGPVDYVSLWPASYQQPFVATVNDPQGMIVANAAIVPAGTPSGGISVYNAGPSTTDVVIDMNGYFTAPTDVNYNTAVGAGALANTTGTQNTASGYGALQNNTTGDGNTASGAYALHNDTSGQFNAANGASALASNTTGNFNTAMGAAALQNNTTGGSNTAMGWDVLQNNSTGGGNTASGQGALFSNTSGNDNTAIGEAALVGNSTGSDNIAIGSMAAYNVMGSNNIHIGSQGSSGDGETANSGVIRIGMVGTQTSTYIAGISGATPGYPNLPVCVDGSGQLGTVCGISPSAQMQPNEAQKQNAKIEQLEKRLAALEALLSGQSAATRPASSQ